MTRNETTEDIEAEVCIDCALYWANADLSGVESLDRQIEIGLAKGVPDNCTVAIGDEAGFSWSRCEACLSPLGGDRFGASFVVVRAARV